VVQQRKEDIICAFHNDMETLLKDLQKELKNIQRWRYRSIGFSAGVSVTIGLTLVPLLKALEVI